MAGECIMDDCELYNGNPSPKEIRQLCREIRKGWSRNERMSRTAFNHVRLRWIVPQFFTHHWQSARSTMTRKLVQIWRQSMDSW